MESARHHDIPYRGWEEYLRDHGINQLFQGLMVAIIHHRPDNHLDYMIDCVNSLADKTSSDICWNTFLNRLPQDGACPSQRQLPPLDQAPRNEDKTVEDERKTQNDGNAASQDVGSQMTAKTDKKAKKYKKVQVDRQVAVKDGAKKSEEGSTADPFAVAEEEFDILPLEARLRSLGREAEDILRGDWTNLPALPSHVIRIFLSSTFSDFKAERNILPQRAFPELQAYCQERGLDFQVVDMRWGVTDELANDHQVSTLCINEIIRCQQISRGPNFVVFLGNRYGFQSFPAFIEQSLFEAVMTIAEELELEKRHLLTEWFKLDSNAIPAQYVLQPIVEKLPSYNERGGDGDEKEKEEGESSGSHDRASWAECQQQLRHLLRACVSVARQRAIISQEAHDLFFISVTEEEILQGILRQEDPAKRAVCFVRNLSGLTAVAPDETSASKFIDSDDHSQRRLDELTNTNIVQHLPPENLRNYELPWLGEPLETSNKDEYLSYLHRFSRDFVDQIKRLIEQTHAAQDSSFDELQNLYCIVLHHAKFSRQKIDVFHGMDEEIDTIRMYIAGDWSRACPSNNAGTHDIDDSKTDTFVSDQRMPLIIAGGSGFGKTTLMAFVAQQACQWLENQAIVVARFFGTSPDSSKLLDVLHSTIQQIALLYKFRIPSETEMNTMDKCRKLFWRLLDKVGETLEKKLVLVFDSVDQLEDTHGVHAMIWLPKRLPNNVSLIISMLSEGYECLHHTQSRITDPEQYIMMKPLSKNAAIQIVGAYLDKAHRRVTESQKKHILLAFDKCGKPLFLKLMMDRAKTWYSYTLTSEYALVSSVHEAIDVLFSELEMRFGDIFVQHALGYLTCGNGGISSIEMEDVLSCDDQVLNHVYQYHDPPLEGVIRIPSLMWSRLQHALSEYLAERQVNNKTVFGWYHRQFWEAAEKRYLNTEQQFRLYHSALADIHKQETGIRRSITLHNRRGKVIENADRCVTQQPLVATNTRKLCSMTHHLLFAMRINELKSHCLLNFDWLCVKLLSSTSYELMQNYDHTRVFLGEKDSAYASDRDLLITRELMHLCVDILRRDPLLLAYQINERLSRVKHETPLLARLHQDAVNWMETTAHPLLIPTHRLVLQEPDNPLKLKALAGTTGVLSSDKKLAICRQIESAYDPHCTFNVFDIASAEILVSVSAYNVTYYCLTSDNKTFIYVEKNMVVVREVNSCDLISEIPYEKDFDKFVIRCVALSQDDQYVAVGVRLGNPRVYRRCASGGTIYLVHIGSSTVVGRHELSGKNLLDFTTFIKGDEQILITNRSKIFLIEHPTMTPIYMHQLHDVKLFNFSIRMLADDQTMIGAVGSYTKMKILVFDTSSQTVTYSEGMNVQTKAPVRPFGLATNKQGDKVAVGTHSKEEIPCSSVGLWDRRNDTYLHIHLVSRDKIKPTALAVPEHWGYACVGWANADVTLVDLLNGTQLMEFRVQGQGVEGITLLSGPDSILTFSFDNTINIWNVAECMSRDEQQRSIDPEPTKAKEIGRSPIAEEVGNGSPKTTPNWSDVHVGSSPAAEFAITDQLALTLDENPTKAPLIWTTEDGRLQKPLSNSVQEAFSVSECCSVAAEEASKPLEFGKVIDLGKNKFAYLRYGRIGLSTSIIDTNKPESLRGQVTYLDAYAQVIIRVKDVESSSRTWKQFVVRDGLLEIYRLPELVHESSIPIIKISEDIPNPNSNNGIRKITALKLAVSTDGRYLVMHNSAIPLDNGQKRPLDLVDLERGVFVKRYRLSKLVSGKLLGDGLCYLVLDDDDDDDANGPLLYRPDNMLRFSEQHIGSYMCSLDVGKYISRDGSLGLTKEVKLRATILWRLEPLKKLHNLTGHTSDISGVAISHDNRLVLTGSGDKTVRVYSVSSGDTLCTFHLDYLVDIVRFSPSSEYVGVLCFSEFQHKRLVILKLHQRAGDEKPQLLRRRTTLNVMNN